MGLAHRPWCVARLARLEQLPGAGPPRLREQASYLITGGLGGLGLQTARWLAARGAGHIVLSSRREPDAATRAAIEEIETLGCQVHVLLADVSKSEDVRLLLADRRRRAALAGRDPCCRSAG